METQRDYNQVAHKPAEDNQSLLQLRSKAEQLTGHQQIKVLSTFKHVAVAPLSLFCACIPREGKGGCEYRGQASLQSKTKE
jgi:hypothetical protein